MPNVRFRPQARRDLDEAINFYKSIRKSLAREFVTASRKAETKIKRSADSQSIYSEPYRYVRLGKFPYIFIFRPDQPDYLVITVKHTSRDDNYWLSRE